MSAAMKQLVKKILPPKVLHAAVDIRDRKRLRAVPSCPFDDSRLRTGKEFESPIPFFSDPATTNLWQVVHDEICGSFADDHFREGINPGDRRALFYLVWHLKPKKVLEIGTHIGASTLYIARALKYISDEAKITTVDIVDVNNAETGPWKKLGLPMSPATCADHLNCLDHIVFKTGRSQNFMTQTTDKFDLIFLDGEHVADAVYREVSAALHILNDDGVILLHDYYPKGRALFPDGNVISGPYRALERVIKENPKIEVKPLGALPWETKLGSHMTSLALVTRRG